MSKRIFEANASFDVKSARPKFQVLNRNIKGTNVNVTKTRSKDVNKRKQALKAMLQDSGKSNKFVDKRLGEGVKKDGVELTQDEKDALRYQKLRTDQLRKQSKSNKYALQDEEELTHMGQSLSSMTREQLSGHLDSDSSDSDDEKDGRLSAAATRYAHFGGGFLEGEKRQLLDPNLNENGEQKTKYDIFREIIQNSKLHKQQKQLDNEQLQNELYSLDTEFEEIKALLRYKMDSDDEDALPEVGLDGKIISTKGKSGMETDVKQLIGMSIGSDVSKDTYTAQSNELAMSRRGLATDRLKSDEEIAKAKYALLVRKEQERLRRLNGEDITELSDDELMGWGGSDDDDSGESDIDEKEKENIKLGFSDDDDDDDDDVADDEDDEDEDEDGEASPDIRPMKTAANTGDDNDVDGNVAFDDEFMIYSDDDYDSPDAPMERIVDHKKLKKDAYKAKKEKKVLKELDLSNEDLSIPFTFKAPVDYESYKELFSGAATETNIKRWEIILSRLRTQYNPKLGGDNEFFMQRLYTHFYRHIRTLCNVENKVIESYESSRGSTSTKHNTKQKPLLSCRWTIKSFDMIIRQLFETRELFIKYAKQVDREVVKNIAANIRNRTSGTSKFPTAYELFSVHALTKLYPVTDTRHIITTPVMLLLNECLLKPVYGYADLVKGLFIVSLLLEYVQETKRYIPEIISFLQSALVHMFNLQSSDIPSTLAYDENTSVNIEPRCKEDFAYLITPLCDTITSTLATVTSKFDTCIDKDLPSLYIQHTKSKAADTTIPLKTPLSLLFINDNTMNVFKHTEIYTSIINTILSLIHVAANTYSSSLVYSEVFGPIYACLKLIVSKYKSQYTMEDIDTSLLYRDLPANTCISKRIYSLLAQLSQTSQKLSVLRKPIAKFAKAVAIKEYNPSFQDNFVPGKNNDADKERLETKRLNDKLKKMKRDTARNVRRENQLLMIEKQNMERKMQEKRDLNRKRIMSELQKEATTTNIMDQVSKKKRKI